MQGCIGKHAKTQERERERASHLGCICRSIKTAGYALTLRKEEWNDHDRKEHTLDE